MLFSVIIPTYNRAALLREALESVFAQTLTDYEVIVVDDGSTDETATVLHDYPKVKVLAQSNGGPGAGRNAGARQAQGDYLAFFDSDDLWFPWTLESFAELIERQDRPAILGARLMEFSDRDELKAVQKTPPAAEVFPDYFASCSRGYFVGAGMSVLRRDVFLSTGGYTDQPINSEDHDLILRLGNAAGFAQITAPVTLGWRRHAGSATTNLPRSVAGLWYLLEQERRGAYPGGAGRRWQRREIVTRHARPISLVCLREKETAQGWHLYRATFGWHLRLGRWKYLAGFPMKAWFGQTR